ncbi:MAG TPA: hypothetical protein VG755_22150, partial [Nannocystaceae bacterium]|nr:hypothetical protein [Nannocystaceae bacterium]
MGDESGLIESLRAQGKVAARGHFTLDAEKAREKMRMFQLADPHRWVLLVVQSLVARGAQRLAIAVDTDDLVIVCDARPFEHNELADIHGVILGETAPGPGLRELALGLNAALALNPRWLRLDSSEKGGAGVRLEQRPEQPDRVEAIAECEPGVRLHVKERFRPGLLARFFRVGSDALREQVLLRLHCRLAAIEITMNGQRLQDLQRDPTVPRWERVELAGRWVGRVGLSTDGSQGRVDVLRHEVWLSTHTFLQPELSGLRAVIDASDLRTDVSMAEVVRDEAYETLLSAVQRALDPIVTDAVAAFAHGQLPPWLAVHLAARIAVRGLAYPLSPAMTAWLGVKLWTTLDGRALSTFDLLGRTLVGFTTEYPDEVPQEVGSVVDGRHGAAERLQAILGDRCRDRTDAVRLSMQRMLAKRQFESRKHPAGLPDDPGYYDHVEIVGEQGRCGELAFHALAPERGWLRVVVDGCLLSELPLDLPMHRAHAVITGRFTPTELYDDVQRTPVLVDALYATLVAYDRAVQALAREHATRLDTQGREELCRYVTAMQSDDAALAWLASVGVAAPLAQKLLRERGRPWRLSAGEIVAESDNPIVRVPMFEDAGAVPLDLLAIAEHVRKASRVRVVAKGRPLLVNAPELVVRTDEKRLKLLTAIFGARAVERAGKDFDRWVARDEFLGKHQVAALALQLPARIGPFTLQVHGNEVVVGIADETRSFALGRSAYISVFAEQRPLCVVRTPCGLSNVQLAIAADPRWVNPKYDGLVGGLANPGIESALVAGLCTLIDGIVRSAESSDPSAFVLELAAMAWPGPTWLEAWHAIGRGRDADERDRCFAEL